MLRTEAVASIVGNAPRERDPSRVDDDMARLNVNGADHDVDVEPDTPLLWVIREQLGMTGTKYSCGIAACGACTVHIDGVATRSCALPVSAVEQRQKIAE